MTQIETMLRAPSAFLIVLRQELLLLWRDRSLPIVIALLIALLAGALGNGFHYIDQKEEQMGVFVAEQNKAREKIAEALNVAEAGGAPTPFAAPRLIASNPATQVAILPMLPLAPFALGQSDLSPNYLRMVGFSEAQFLYESDIENPWRLTSGQFDPAFVVVFLLPLLIFGLSYNLFSAEREQGTSRLLLAQPVSPTSVALAKAAARAVALTATLLAPLLVAALLLRPVEDRSELLAGFALWTALALAYGLFWLALALLVNSFGRSSAFNALVLVGAWVALTLVTPIALNLAVDTIRPAPSRAAMIEMLTEASEEAARHNAELDRTDYAAIREAMKNPTAMKDRLTRVSASALRGFNMQKEISEKLTPWVRDFEMRAEERQNFVDAFRILSPAAIVLEGMNAVAGTDSDRYNRFRRAAAEFYRDKTAKALPRMQSGVLTTEAEFRAAPGFEWPRDRFSLARSATSLAQILVAAGVIAALSLRRLRHFSV
jgi:ABC-2 type transport system permease protein